MKAKKLLSLLLIIGVMAIAPSFTQAQSIGKPDGNTFNFFSTNSTGKMLGHREAGSFGSFSSSSQWIGIGQPVTFPGSSTKVPAYGLRSQWLGQAGIFSLKGSGQTKDLAIEWGSNSNSKLRFSFISDLNNPSALKEVMTMASSGRVGIGVTNPIASLDINTISNSSLGSTTFGVRNIVNGSNFRIYGNYNSLTASSAYSASGVESRVSGTTAQMYGGYFQAANSTTSSNITYGIFATASGNGPNVWAGYFSGNVFVSGTLTHASDRKFKTDIDDLSKSDIVSKLMKLQPSSYYYKSGEGIKFGKGLQYGFVAQEVEKVFPDLVQEVTQPAYNGTDEFGNPIVDEDNMIEFKSVNYTGMIPILTKALQEQELTMNSYRSEIDELKAKNEELVEKFSKLMTAIESGDRTLLNDVVETSETSLGQNQPNPFGQSTEITYSLSSSVQKATIQIYNMDGKLLGDYPLNKDEKSVQLNANTYEPGVYVYVMIADGKTVGTRRMIISQ